VNSKTYVIDADPELRERVSAVALTLGLDVDCHESGESFLSEFSPDETGCIISEMRLCGISGLELLEHLISMDSCMPVIFLTGHARTQTTVAAMQRGAMNVLEKPLDEDEVWNAIRRGLIVSDGLRRQWETRRNIRRRFASLTDNEAAVSEMIVSGMTNKQIASSHEVSIRTIESRRQKIYNKLGVKSLPGLVEITIQHQASHKPDNQLDPNRSHIAGGINSPTKQVQPN